MGLKGDVAAGLVLTAAGQSPIPAHAPGKKASLAMANVVRTACPGGFYYDPPSVASIPRNKSLIVVDAMLVFVSAIQRATNWDGVVTCIRHSVWNNVNERGFGAGGYDAVAIVFDRARPAGKIFRDEQDVPVIKVPSADLKPGTYHLVPEEEREDWPTIWDCLRGGNKALKSMLYAAVAREIAYSIVCNGNRAIINPGISIYVDGIADATVDMFGSAFRVTGAISDLTLQGLVPWVITAAPDGGDTLVLGSSRFQPTSSYEADVRIYSLASQWIASQPRGLGILCVMACCDTDIIPIGAMAVANGYPVNASTRTLLVMGAHDNVYIDLESVYTGIHRALSHLPPRDAMATMGFLCAMKGCDYTGTSVAGVAYHTLVTRCKQQKLRPVRLTDDGTYSIDKGQLYALVGESKVLSPSDAYNIRRSLFTVAMWETGYRDQDTHALLCRRIIDEPCTGDNLDDYMCCVL